MSASGSGRKSQSHEMMSASEVKADTEIQGLFGAAIYVKKVLDGAKPLLSH